MKTKDFPSWGSRVRAPFAAPNTRHWKQANCNQFSMPYIVFAIEKTPL